MGIFLIVIGYRYQQYLLTKNYTLEINTICNPRAERCFKLDGADSSVDPESASYKKVDILAQYAPACLEEHTCTDFSCAGISQCTITYCATDTIVDGESCISDIIQ